MTNANVSVQHHMTQAWTAVRAVPRRRLIALLLVLLLAYAVVYVFEPRIESSVGAPPDAGHAILTPFVVTNNGFFPWRDVHLQCVARETEFTVPAGAANSRPRNLEVTNVVAVRVAPGQNSRVTCDKGFASQAGQLRFADVNINVCLKPYPVIDYISLVHFRYVGERGADGNIHWTAQPMRSSSIPWMFVRRESDQSECVWAE